MLPCPRQYHTFPFVSQLTSSKGFGDCLESTAGIFQLSLQWLLFTIMYVSTPSRLVPSSSEILAHSLVLYMIYYPPHLKYATLDIDMHDDMPPHHVKTTAKSNEWKLSIILSWVVLIHLHVSIRFSLISY